MRNDMFIVTPMTQKISLEAGQVYEGKIRVANPSDATRDFSFKVEVSPYGVAGEDYDADLVTKTNRTMIADWITIQTTEGTLAPNETCDIKFSVTVPEDAPAGAQYSAIVVRQDEATKETTGMNFENVFEMASIIYADVAGETIHEGNILENNIPGFSTTVPITLTAKLDNHGNVHDDATVVISVKNAITGEVYLPTGNNDGRYTEIVIPDTTKNVSRKVESMPLLGVFNVEQTIYYNGHVSTESRTVVICPIWFMILVAVAVIATTGLVARLVYKHRLKQGSIETF